MTLPNWITLSRIALTPLLILLLFFPPHGGRIAAAALFVVLVLSDAVDGYIARRFKSISVFGKYLDPLADKVLIVSTLVALVELRVAPSVPVIILVAREFAVTAFRLAAVDKGMVIAASFFGKVKTVSQMAAVLLLIMGWPYGTEVLWISVGLTVLSGLDYIARCFKKVF